MGSFKDFLRLRENDMGGMAGMGGGGMPKPPMSSKGGMGGMDMGMGGGGDEEGGGRDQLLADIQGLLDQADEDVLMQVLELLQGGSEDEEMPEEEPEGI